MKPKSKQIQYEVLSPDADGWNELVSAYSSDYNLENQLKIVLITPTGTSSDDVQDFLDKRINQDASCSIECVMKSKYKQFKFNKEKLYWVVDLTTYNPFIDIPDAFQLDE